MAMVFAGLTQIFVDFGLGLAIVQARCTDRITLSSSFWLALSVSAVAATVLACGASLIGHLYHDDELVPVLELLAVNILLSGTMIVPVAILQRDLRFAALARATLLSSVVGSGSAVGMACWGFGVWSLVAQPLAGTSCFLVAITAESRWRPSFEFSLQRLHGLLRFSGHVLGSSLLTYLNRNADNFLVGRYLGSDALGFYGMAYQLMLYPLGQITAVVTKVSFPTLSQLYGDMVRFRAAYLESCTTISMVTFPMMLGLLVVSRQFVEVVLGAKWLPIVVLLQIFCPLGMLQSIATTVGTLYMSSGNTRAMFWFTLATTPLFLGSFVVGLKYGLLGITLSYAVVYAGITYFSMRIALSLVGLRFLDIIKATWRCFVCAVIMAAAVCVVDSLFFGLLKLPVAHLAAEVVFGASVYLLMSLLINWHNLSRVAARLRASLTSASTAAAP